ncbi:serine/arginine-rich splicing factor RS2Z33-like [Actinia tenebrosa]|uniref:Serine/arginine-rich splicing factor RS2Z33-like n=1 Tax=Actinia tenebrosa TaxID=6105 RepID=A0A6P8I310_ACTTE|nr:serine/arginine-rich splicing factor RS2Z33-like [Actinia tenebrosa]
MLKIKMARGGTELFVGRLSKETKQRDLENVFYLYGKLSRCDIKYGRERAYGFIEYEDPRDAEEALRRENNRKLFGSRIVVEYVKGKERGGPAGDECFKCGRLGHWASSCTVSRDDTDGFRGSGRHARPSPAILLKRPPPSRYRSRSRSPRRFPNPPPRRRRSLSPPRRPRPPPISRSRDRYRR